MNRVTVSFTSKKWGGKVDKGCSAEASVGFEVEVEEGDPGELYKGAEAYLTDAKNIVHGALTKPKAAAAPTPEPAAEPPPEPEPAPAPSEPKPQSGRVSATTPTLVADAGKTVEIDGLKCFWISDKSILVGDPRAAAGKDNDNDKKTFLPLSKITTSIAKKDDIGKVIIEKWLFKEKDDDDADRAAGKRFLRAIVAGGFQASSNPVADELDDDSIPF